MRIREYWEQSEVGLHDNGNNNILEFTESRHSDITKIHVVDNPIFHKIADLYSLQSDLKQARHGLEKAAMTSGDTNWDNQQCFLAAAHLAYRRCFDGSGGRRTPLKQADVQDVEGFENDLHKKLMATASKFVAHSVNTQEQPVCGVLVDETGEPKVVVCNYRLRGYLPEQIMDMSNHIGSLVQHLDTKLENAVFEASALVEKMTPEGVAKLALWKPEGIDPEKVRTGMR